MDPADLMMFMDKFDPQKQQQEQLAIQALAQQLELGRAAEERAQVTHAAAQQRAMQLDPLALQLQQALVNRIPAQDEAAQAAAAAARLGQEQAEFTLGQSRANAPVVSAGHQAALAASLAGPQHQQEQLALQRSEAERKALHDAAILKITEEQNRNTRLGTVLDVLRQGGVPGMAPNAAEIGQLTGNLLRPAGTEAGFNAALAQGTGPANAYLTQFPEARGMIKDPKLLADLASGALAGTQAPGGTSTVPGAGAPVPAPRLVPPVAGEPVTNWDQWRQLENIESAKSHLSPEALTSPLAALQLPIHAWNVNRNFWGSQAHKLMDMRPTQQEYLATQEAKRRALLGR